MPWSRVGSWITTHEFLVGLAKTHDVNVVGLQMTHDPYEIDGIKVWPAGTEVPSPDVMISHLGDNGFAAHMAAGLGIPSVRFVHGHHEDNRVKLEQFPTALAIYSSQALATDVGWDGPQLVAHPPVWADRFRVKPGKMVTLSNLSAAKGGLLFGHIAEAHPYTRFLGVRGWGRQMPQPRNVEVIPPVKDMRRVYRQTRILCMPSDRESYGRVAVEAAVSGIPTVAHPSPGLVEAMGDHATWVDRNDKRGWIEKVGELLRPKAWRAASDRALELRTDPEASVARVVEAIGSL